MFATEQTQCEKKGSNKISTVYLKLDPVTQLNMHCFTMKLFSNGYEYIKNKKKSKTFICLNVCTEDGKEKTFFFHIHTVYIMCLNCLSACLSIFFFLSRNCYLFSKLLVTQQAENLMEKIGDFSIFRLFFVCFVILLFLFVHFYR